MVSGVWLSLVERCVRDAEAAGSNPVTPTKLMFIVGLFCYEHFLCYTIKIIIGFLFYVFYILR